MPCTTTCRKPNGNQSHCGACHQTFSTVANFDRHRTGDVEHRRCVEDPATVGLNRGADLIWREPPGTWMPRAPHGDDARTAEHASGALGSGSGIPEPAESLSGGDA